MFMTVSRSTSFMCVRMHVDMLTCWHVWNVTCDVAVCYKNSNNKRKVKLGGGEGGGGGGSGYMFAVHFCMAFCITSGTYCHCFPYMGTSGWGCSSRWYPQECTVLWCAHSSSMRIKDVLAIDYNYLMIECRPCVCVLVSWSHFCKIGYDNKLSGLVIEIPSVHIHVLLWLVSHPQTLQWVFEVCK